MRLRLLRYWHQTIQSLLWQSSVAELFLLLVTSSYPAPLKCNYMMARPNVSTDWTFTTITEMSILEFTIYLGISHWFFYHHHSALISFFNFRQFSQVKILFNFRQIFSHSRLIQFITFHNKIEGILKSILTAESFKILLRLKGFRIMKSKNIFRNPTVKF